MPLHSGWASYGQEEKILVAQTISVPEQGVRRDTKLYFTGSIWDDGEICESVLSRETNVAILGCIENKVIELSEDRRQLSKIVGVVRLVEARKSAWDKDFLARNPR